MIGTLVAILIALIVAGFVFWGLTAILNAIAPYMAAPFVAIAHVVIIVIAVAIVIFYVVVPLLHMLTGISIPMPQGLK